MDLFLFRYEKPYLKHCHKDCKIEIGTEMAGRHQHNPSIITEEVNEKPLFE